VHIIDVLLIAVGLAMDAFAVSLGAATAGHARTVRPAFRLSFHFGLFQFLMPVIGWFLGYAIQGWIIAVDHWIAFALLAFVGGHMIHGGLAPEHKRDRGDPTRGWTLIVLCIATSIDALAIGLSLAMLRVSIWYPSVVIGVVTASLSLVGVHLGNRVGEKLGPRMEIAGGLILIGIGVKILISHLAG
jgi:manganese efflux pump family protein